MHNNRLSSSKYSVISSSCLWDQTQDWSLQAVLVGLGYASIKTSFLR